MMKKGIEVKVDARYGASVTVRSSTYFPENQESKQGPVERFELTFDAPVPVLVFTRHDAIALRNVLNAALAFPATAQDGRRAQELEEGRTI